MASHRSSVERRDPTRPPLASDLVGPVTVALEGELDIAALPYLWRKLGEAVTYGSTSTVVVDLSAVTFLDCYALRPLVAAHAALAGRLELQGATGPVRRLFDLNGLTGLLSAADPGSRMGPVGSDAAAPPVTTLLLGGFARMAGFVLSAETVASALRLVTSLAAETLPHTIGASVTLLRADAPASAAASDAVVERADELQYLWQEGPCLTALRLGDAVRIDDVVTETRWPRWSKAVAALGVRAVLSTPMLVDGEPMGAIKVYSREAGAYGSHEEHVLALFAAQAAILLANMRSHENATALTERVTAAMRARDVISMAKGMLMVTRRIEESAAFAILSQTSQRSATPIAEVAQHMLDYRCAGNR